MFVSIIKRQRQTAMERGTGRGEGMRYELGFIGLFGPKKIVERY